MKMNASRKSIRFYKSKKASPIPPTPLQKDKNRRQDGTQKLAKWISNLPKLNQNGAKRGRGRSRMGPRGLTWSQHGDKGGSTCWEDRFGHEKVANMAARWAPISSQNRWKIDAKIDQKNDAFQDRFLERFWWIFWWKMDASWHPNGIKNRSFLRNVEKQKMLIKPICF